jgi:hypothetical protein
MEWKGLAPVQRGCWIRFAEPGLILERFEDKSAQTREQEPELNTLDMKDNPA